MKIIIGTRGSKLALTQAEYVKTTLERQNPADVYAIKIIRTRGDRVQHLALDQIGDKGLFVREIEQELLDGTIDLAVHSMKDMPAEQPKGLVFARAWKREDPRDVLVLRDGMTWETLPKGAKIATGSKRRAMQLLLLRPDLEIVGIRGNVDTRIQKMHEQQLDGIVLAAAGLHRLGRTEVITQYLSYDVMIPAAAQGTLAIELRAGRDDLLEKVNACSDDVTEEVTQTERLFLQGTGGTCHMPIGAYAQKQEDGTLCLRALYGNEDGSLLKKCRVYGRTPQETAEAALKELFGS